MGLPRDSDFTDYRVSELRVLYGWLSKLWSLFGYPK